MDCFICSATLRKSLSPVYDPQTREAFSILLCEGCGAGQTWPRPQNLDPYYSSYYGKRHGWSAAFCARRRLAWVHYSTKGKKGRLLDFGCGDGSFLREAAQAGWQVAGVERKSGLASAAGFEAYTELCEAQARAPFDCITFWHTLEHLEAPQSVLRQARDLLTPHGCLLIAVPNAQGWQARVFGAKWLHHDVPRHLHHFGAASLRRLLQAEKFEPVQWRHQEFEYDLLGWSQSALNCLFSVPNVFFQELTGHPVAANPWLRFLSWTGGLLFSALALPLLPLSACFGAGGTLVVTARLSN